MKLPRICFALALCVPLTVAAESRVDHALRHVPEDSALIVVAPDWQAFTQGLHQFGEAAGIDALAELDTAQTLAEFLGGCSDDLKPRGTVLMATRLGPQKPLFVGRLLDSEFWSRPPADPGVVDGVRPVQIGAKTWFAARAGAIDILADTRETLQKARTSDGGLHKRFAQSAGRLLKGNQLAVWVDIDAWRSFLEPSFLVGEGLMRMSIAMSDPDAHGSLAMWELFFEEARLLFKESHTYAAGFHFGPAGARGSDLLLLKPDGQFAACLGQLRTTGRDGLRGLVGDPGMMTFATEWLLPEGTTPFSEAMLRAMIDAHEEHGGTIGPDARKGIEAAARLYRRVTGYSGKVDKAAGGGLTVTGFYLTENPDAVLQDLKSSFATLTDDELMGMMSSMLTMDVTHHRERVGDVRAEVFTMVFKTQQPEVKEAIRSIYGERVRYYAATHRDGVVYGMGTEDAGRVALERILNAGSRRLMYNDRIIHARKTIRPNPHVEAFLDLPALADFVIAVAQKLGNPAPPLVFPEKDTPLVAFGVYLEPTAMLSEMFVPAPYLRSLFDAVDPQKTAASGGGAVKFAGSHCGPP